MKSKCGSYCWPDPYVIERLSECSPVLCTIWRYFVLCFRRDTLGDIESMLFVKLAEQGSTVLALEAIEHAINLVGRDNVHFVVFEENRFILDAMRLVPEGNVTVVKHDNIFVLFSSGIAALTLLRSRRIGAVVDLEFFSRFSALISYIVCKNRRVGFHAYGVEGLYRGDLFTHKAIYNPHLHTSKSFMSLVQIVALPPDNLPASSLVIGDEEMYSGSSLGKDIGQVRTIYTSCSKDEIYIEELLRSKSGVVSPFLIILNANCSDMLPIRRWPEERYVILAKRLLLKYPELFVSFTGSASEATKVNTLVESVAHPRCFSVAGETTLPELLTLYGKSQVLVTNDSGPAHFASLTSISVVVMFGPETPKLFGVRSSLSHNLCSNLACSPCVSAYNNRSSVCRNNLCLKFISVDEVFSTVCKVYESRLR